MKKFCDENHKWKVNTLKSGCKDNIIIIKQSCNKYYIKQYCIYLQLGIIEKRW